MERSFEQTRCCDLDHTRISPDRDGPDTVGEFYSVLVKEQYCGSHPRSTTAVSRIVAAFALTCRNRVICARSQPLGGRDLPRWENIPLR